MPAWVSPRPLPTVRPIDRQPSCMNADHDRSAEPYDIVQTAPGTVVAEFFFTSKLSDREIA